MKNATVVISTKCIWIHCIFGIIYTKNQVVYVSKKHKINIHIANIHEMHGFCVLILLKQQIIKSTSTCFEDGILTMTDATMWNDAAVADVLFVPGGLGTRTLQHDVTWSIKKNRKIDSNSVVVVVVVDVVVVDVDVVDVAAYCQTNALCGLVIFLNTN